jgi:2-epi-5-epi-valiolone 7-phosphate 2-epimerase
LAPIIGVTQWSVDGRGPETLYKAAELGFRAVHLDSGALGSDLLLDSASLQAEYVAAAQDSGVAIGAISPPVNDCGVCSPAGSQAARQCWRLIETAIGAAAKMRVPLVFVPSFREGEIRTEAQLVRTADVLRQACEAAAPHAVLVATENTLGVQGNLQLLAAANHPNLRVLLDTQNPVLWGHDAATLAEALWPRLANQVHVKDGAGGQMGNTPLGAGEAAFARTAQSLRALGFAGMLISENDYSGANAARAAPDIAMLESVFDR